jgi:TonB family protein
MGAMNFFSDPQVAASRFGDYIEDLHDVFRCNGIDFGSPQDFLAFARVVKYHSDLRGDVMRVVKSLMESEMNISFRTILTVIAVASGGAEVATSDREMNIPVKLIVESLTNVGVCNQFNADQADQSADVYPDLTANEAVQISTLVESLPDEEAIAHVDGPGYAGVEGLFSANVASNLAIDLPIDQGLSNEFQGLSNGTGGSNTLAESLSRLELNSLQLKIYLDSIDQRISRMEPRLENVAPAVLSATPSRPREEAGARFSATISSGNEPQPPQNDAPVLKQQKKEEEAATGAMAMLVHLRTDFRQLYATKRRRALPIFAGVVMLLLAASFFRGSGRDTSYVAIRPVNASLGGAADASIPSPAPRGAAASESSLGPVGESHVATASDPSVTPAKESQGNSAAPSYTGPGVSGTTDRSIHSPKKSAQVSFRSSPSRSSALTEASPVVATETSDGVEPPDRTSGLNSDPLSNHLVTVSSGVMAANLVSGPKPSYPALASLIRTQGNVVMQAVISKKGTVEHLHVIQGHRLLRSAAKNAVRTWRYRPYKIDGVPVEVSTIVTVDFSLHR